MSSVAAASPSSRVAVAPRSVAAASRRTRFANKATALARHAAGRTSVSVSVVVVRASGDIPPSRGSGGFTGGRLIVPGSPDYDPSIVQVNRPGGAQQPGKFPGGYDAPPKPGSEKAAGEAFAPFRPPSEYIDGANDFAEDSDEMALMRLRQRGGSWYQLAPLFERLKRSGMTPDDIFDEVGIEPKEQSLWVTWSLSRGSLAADPRFPDEKLAYFDNEYTGAPNLSHIQYLTAEKRSEAAEFVVDNEFDPDQTKELVKAYEIRTQMDSQAKGFGTSPGECLAFKMWRDVQEVQRYQGIDVVNELVAKGKRFAENASTMERLDAIQAKWAMDLSEGGVMAEGGSLAKANAEARANISVVRLDSEELSFRAVPMLGPLDKLSVKAYQQVETTKSVGVFGVFTPPAGGVKDWVALPKWAALEAATLPFAVLVDNTGELRNAGDLSSREEPGLLLVDKASTTPNPASYYLAARESRLQLSGGKNAEVIDVYPGRDVMEMESENIVTVLGRVVLCVRAPGGMDDGMTTEFVG